MRKRLEGRLYFLTQLPKLQIVLIWNRRRKKRTYTECFPLGAGSSFNLEEERDVH